MLGIHHGFNDTSTTTPTELSHKKNTIGKRINLNKSNVNCNTSDVVSNQSIINMDNNNQTLNHNTNNRKHGDANGRNNNVYHTTNNNDSDILNNNASDTATNENYAPNVRANHSADRDSTKAMHMVNNVNTLHAKVGDGIDAGAGYANHVANANYSPPEPSQPITFNERSHFNQLTGKLMSSAANAPALIENATGKVVSSNDKRLPITYAHNHNDIVQYVVLGKLYFELH